MPDEKKAIEGRKKLCLISASGGHYEQLSMLKPLEKKYNIFWVTEHTGYKGNADYYLIQTGSNDMWVLFKMLKMCMDTLKIWIKEKPDAIVTTGTLAAVPMCLLAKLLKKKVVYIETYARVKDCTRAGKFMYKVADLFIYQWEQLAEYYPDGIYGGSIY